MPRRAADSTGIKVEGEWRARKHGGSKRWVCPKAFLSAVALAATVMVWL